MSSIKGSETSSTDRSEYSSGYNLEKRTRNCSQCISMSQNKRIKLEDSFKICHIDNLPAEVMKHIFSFLTPKEKLITSLVSRNWLSIMDDLALLDDIVLVLEGDRPCKIWQLNNRSVYFSKRYTNIKFSNKKFSLEDIDFFGAYGKFWKRLDIIDCSIDDEFNKPSICDKNKCQNLRELQISGGCIIKIFQSLPALETLHLQDLQNETDSDFVYLKETIENLKCFYFNSNKVVSDIDDLKKIYSDSLDYSGHASKTAVTSLVILDFIKKHFKTLIDIQVFDKTLYNEVLQLKELQLQKLELDKNLLHDSSPSSVIEIVRRYPLVKVLDLTGLTLEDKHIDFICAHLSNLESLSLGGSNCRSNLKSVFQLKHLQSLSLEHFNANENLEEAIKAYQIKSLKHLLLFKVNMTNNTLRDLLKKMTQLISLRLILHPAVNDETLRFINEHLVCLQSIEILFHHITDAGFFNLSNPRQCISNIKGLKVLKLGNYNGDRISNETLLQALKFPELHTLTMQRKVNKDYQELIDFIKKLREQNPKLRHLTISY